ncbi:MAG: sulfatase-like hydrolase/transferase [Candidatus Cybelea sp.]
MPVPKPTHIPSRTQRSTAANPAVRFAGSSFSNIARPVRRHGARPRVSIALTGSRQERENRGICRVFGSLREIAVLCQRLVGDRNESLPTVNGFDEFFGNLYHLNAEEEPELPNYPKDPAYRARFGPRGVLKCEATATDDPTVDPRFGKIGKQSIEDTGPLTKKRMETIDDETSDAAIDYMKRQQAAGRPFFCWFNSTRMHLRTHVRESHRGRYPHGDCEYIDGMMEHDDTIGKILNTLDEMGIADDTIVMYTSDNGPHMNTWPDGAMTWFRSEKDTNWEGAFRVPCLVRWPGVIKPGTVTNELMSHNDWVPTLCSIAGEPDIAEKLKKGYEANDRDYTVHLDGYDQSAFLKSVSGTACNNNGVKSERNTFFYTDDDGLLVALRHGDYKYVYAE